MESDRLPAWAILPAAFKLVGASVIHPTTAKTIIADPATHKVSVISSNENGILSREHPPGATPSVR